MSRESRVPSHADGGLITVGLFDFLPSVVNDIFEVVCGSCCCRVAPIYPITFCYLVRIKISLA